MACCAAQATLTSRAKFNWLLCEMDDGEAPAVAKTIIQAYTGFIITCCNFILQTVLIPDQDILNDMADARVTIDTMHWRMARASLRQDSSKSQT